MAKITMDEFEVYPVFPDNSIIITTVQECIVKDVSGAKGDWQKLEFTFKVDGIQVLGDGASVDTCDALIGSKIWGSVPFRFTESPDNRLKQWVEAIIGMELSVGFELDTDLLEGRKVRAVTGSYAKRTTDPKTGAPYRAHQVDSLLAFGGGETAPALASVGAPAVADPWAAGEPPF